MKPGDIHWVELPGGAGRAQAGRRPAIVLQDEAASDRLPMVLMVPLTTPLEALRFPGTVLIEAEQQNGLRRASVALVFQMTSIDQRFVETQLGTISPDRLNGIWSALDELTGRGRPSDGV